MRQYFDTVQDNNGNAIRGATVVVKDYPAGAPASIFTDNGLTPIASSTVTTDTTGAFYFFAADGDYTLEFYVNGNLEKTQAPVSLFDGAAQVTYTDVGAVNAIATLDSSLEKALRTGLRAYVLVSNTNTTAATFSYNGLAAKPVVLVSGLPIPAGALVSGGRYLMEYTGTAWQTLGLLGIAVYAETPTEAATGAVIIDDTRQPGDPRRYHNITVTDQEIKGLYCNGFVPTYVDSDTFTVAGDASAYFLARTRLAVFSASERKFGQVLSAVYSAPNTTVEMRMEIGNLPAAPLAVLVYVSPILDHTNTFMVDFNAPQVMQVINKNTGAAAATQLFVGDFVNSGIGIIGTKPTTVGSFPGGVYYSLAPNNPIAAITTGLAIPICIVTHDRTRLIIDGDGLPSQFTTSLVVQQTNENPNGSTTSKVTIDGTATGYLSLKVNGVEVAVYSSTVSAASFGTITNIPLDFYTNSTKRATIDGAGNVVAGPAAGAISTSATDGFLYIPSCAGTPSGTPTAKSGMCPMVVDATNNRLYFYSSGAWRNAGP